MPAMPCPCGACTVMNAYAFSVPRAFVFAMASSDPNSDAGMFSLCKQARSSRYLAAKGVVCADLFERHSPGSRQGILDVILVPCMVFKAFL